jgi:hypothetical protein
MLAYLFWHEPRPGLDETEYTALLQSFHAALAGAPPAGFRRSWSVRLQRAPWEGGPAGIFEDWYLVDDWTAIGNLNDNATKAPRDEAHREIASRATNGRGAIYRFDHGTLEGPAPWAGWLPKPDGASYDEFVPELVGAAASGGETAILRRQMVLGPAPEYVVLAERAPSLPWPVNETAPQPLDR